ncbi:phage replisome organizer N-terminal domain-containing protein [Pectinatus frisingensis]|uniref:phage replisome organizer N-terminal domain-containing protein n=1 Tax=Pectinatus frisingensis TaxID=865 RepID=UPI003D809FE1
MNEKRFYWIKLKTDFFEMPEIDWLQEQENGCEYIVLYQKLCLLAANTGGELIRQVGTMMIPYDVKKIAEITKFPFDTVAVALELYKKIGLILTSEDNILTIINHEEMVGSETKWAAKKRLQRRQKEDNVPKLSSKCPPTLSDKSIEIRDKSIEIKDKDIKTKEKQEKEVVVVDSQQEVFVCYSDNIHPISGTIEISRLTECIARYGPDIVKKAINTAVGQNKRTLSYVEGILRNWDNLGYPNKPPEKPKRKYNIDF